jgi:hypothetical protein
MHKNNSSVMKRWVAGLSASFVMALSGLATEPAQAQMTNSSIYCGSIRNGTPATIFNNGRGREFVLFVWTRELAQGWSREARCGQVSSKFDSNLVSGSLRYIVSGIANNGLPVLCASPKRTYGRITCQDANILMTLRNYDSPEAFIEALNDINENRNPNPMSHSSSPLESNYNLNVEVWIRFSQTDYGDPDKFFDYTRASDNSGAYLQRVTFYCGMRNDIPTTRVRTSKFDIPIIIWKSKKIMNSGLTPEENCQNVSNRFEELRQKNAFNYIISGVVNDLPAICAVKAENKPCTSEGLLFELGKDTDPQKILKQMFLSNSDIPVDDNGVGKRDSRDSVCMSRSASGNCSGLLISAIEL